jgi:hypothetical protein
VAGARLLVLDASQQRVGVWPMLAHGAPLRATFYAAGAEDVPTARSRRDLDVVGVRCCSGEPSNDAPLTAPRAILTAP